MKLSKALWWVLLTNVGWTAACGGTSSRNGGGGSGGAEGGPGGSKTADSGSSAKGGSGTAAGAAATGGMVSGPVAAAGGMASGPVAGTGATSSAQRCKVQEDCPGLDAPFEDCGDGTYANNVGYCDEMTGWCKRRGDVCPAKCAQDSDCPVLELACTACNDGTQACPTNECVGGRCHTTYPGCSGYDPCKDRVCDAYCTSCGPNEDCGASVLSFCNDRGKCQAGLSHCGRSSCDTLADCGAPPTDCVACSNDTCAARDCVDNQCVLACPPGTTRVCKSTDECLNLAAPGQCTPCPNGACASPVCLQNACQLVCPL